MSSSDTMSPARVRLRALLVLAALAATVASGSAGTSRAASTGSSVVGATVLSATNLGVAGCPSGLAGTTSFGSVTAGSTNVMTNDCSVVFGSSNDTAMLRVRQADGYSSATNTAMNLSAFTAETLAAAGDVYSTSVVDGGRAWAATQGGKVYRSTDLGDTWTGVATGAAPDLWDVYAVDSSVVWAVGMGGTIVKSTDGGVTWAIQASGTATHLNGIAAADGQRAITGGWDGDIRATTDGGATWVSRGAAGGIVGSVDYADGTYWIASSSGQVLRSDDGGVTFQHVDTGDTDTLEEGIAAVDRNVAYVFGNSGSAWKTTNAGASWSPLVVGTADNFWGADAIDAQNVVAVTEQGDVWRTSDGGATFQLVFDGSTTLDGVSAIDANTILAARWGGVVQRTPGTAVPDFQSGTSDWTAGAVNGMFGACLRNVVGGATTDVDTWAADTVDQDCLDGNADPWRAISASPTKVAESIVSTTQTAQANLRFGLKVGTASPPGGYLAPLEFSVLAPNT